MGERIPRTDEVTGSNPVCSIHILPESGARVSRRWFGVAIRRSLLQVVVFSVDTFARGFLSRSLSGHLIAFRLIGHS